MKLEKGQIIEDFSYCSQFGCKESFLNELKNDKNVLLFLRYIGCTVCNLTILEIRDRYSEFKEKGIGVYVVLQSDLDVLKDSIKDENIEFEIISDPNMELYEKFSLEAAEKLEDLQGENTMERIIKAKERGLEHGKYEGNELQLPATFILDKDGKVLFEKYGKHVTDNLLVDEMLSLEEVI